jgi:hypothetical protein
MLKTLVVTLVVLGSCLAQAEDIATGSEDIFAEPQSCRVQVIQALQIPDAAMDADPETITADIPTEEYVDYLVHFADKGRVVVATMRCYKDGRPMERLNVPSI